MADISPEDAEEYTQALGQVVAGGWRQVALGRRLGVPQALGLTTEQWVENRLGGYVRLSVEARREAVRELKAEGLSTREAGEVLGVSNYTISTDNRAVSNLTPEPANAGAGSGEAVSNLTPEPAPQVDETEPWPGAWGDSEELIVSNDEDEPEGGEDEPREPDRLPINGAMSVAEANGFTFADPIRETDEERAYQHLAKVAVWAKLDADEVAAVCADPGAYLHTFEAFHSWMTRFVAALRSRRASPIRAIK